MVSRRRPHIHSYVPVALLLFLILKLGLSGVFVFTGSPALPVPILEAMPAFATDGEEKKAPSQSPIPPSDPRPVASNATEYEDAEFSALEQKRAQVNKQRRLLKKEEKRLTALKQEIDSKLSRLTQMQNAIESKLAEHKTLQDNRIKHLIKIYTTMPPKKAAALIERLEMKVIIALFSRMKGENVGGILPHVSADKAAKISERLARLGL